MGLLILSSLEGIDKSELNTSGDEPLLRYYDSALPVHPGTEDGTPQEVHDRQAYCLMYWKGGVIGYRRLFSVNGPAGICQENPVVFGHTHCIIRELLAADIIGGVRIDHPDGLGDPFGYLSKLRRPLGDDRWPVTEKILGAEESLDPRLQVDSTTGCNALCGFNSVFVNHDPRDTVSMLTLQRFGSTRDRTAVQAAAQALKHNVTARELVAEIHRLTHALCHDNWSTSDASVDDEVSIDAIYRLVAATPVYRSDYVSLSRMASTTIDEMVVYSSLRVFALNLISADLVAGGEAATRFAQVYGTVMVKGVGDATFYRACRLISLNEVGGDLGRYGMLTAELYLLQSERVHPWPRTMTTLSMHGAKCGEDVRARTLQFSNTSGDWTEDIRNQMAITPVPDDATSYFLLQNVIGVWPASGMITDELCERLHDYTIKAVHEADARISWTEPTGELELGIRS